MTGVAAEPLPRIGMIPARTSRTPIAVPLLLALFAVVASSTSIDPNDTWWHIKSGEYYLQHHAVPSVDVFSHTVHGQRYFAHEWLSQVILFLLYRATGFVGIRVLNSLMAVTSMLLLWRFYRRATTDLLPVLFAIATIFPDFLGRLNTRPEIFTLPLTVGFVHHVLHRDRSRMPRPRELLCVAGLAALWANLHGMALLGLLFLSAWIAGQVTTMALKRVVQVPEWASVSWGSIRSDTALAAVYAVALLLTPLGPRIYVHAWESRHFLPGPLGIMEWLSPFQFLGGILHSLLSRDFPWINVTLGWQLLFLAIPLACCFALPVLAARRQLPTLGEGFLVLFAIYEAAAAVRFRWLFFVPLFWLVKAMGSPQPSPARDDPRVPVRALVLQPILLLLVTSGVYMMLSRGITFRHAIDTKDYPVGVANFLDDVGIGGNLFNSYNWGGYLIFRLAPAYRVFIDGRTDLYAMASRNLMLDHVTIDTKQSGYQELLDSYGVDVLVATGRIYFPGPELEAENRYSRAQQREQMMRSAEGPVAGTADPGARTNPDAEDDSSQALWTPLLINHEGSIYLRNRPQNAGRLAAVRRFYAARGIPDSGASDPDVAAMIRRHPDLAIRYGVVPEELVRGLIRTASQPASEEALRLKVQLAVIFADLELYRDAIAIFEDVLGQDRYNNEALMHVAMTHHLLGEDDRALLYLDRSATIGRNPGAAVWMRHCATHHLPQSSHPARLPALPELIAEWRGLLHGA